MSGAACTTQFTESPPDRGEGSDHEGRGPASCGAPLLVLAAGFGARLFEAWAYFLNPDEALHVLLARQSSLRLAYQAALTQAHPPLLILVLYYWRWLGNSELVLRLPSVLAGTACCWLAYLWLRQITGYSTALTGLLFLAFSPSLIALSAEIRQYALLWFFMAACLYLAERAVREDSCFLMTLFSLSLCGALLTHYSALLFALSLGAYMLVRLRPYRTHLKLFAVWGAGQVAGAVLGAYFIFTQGARLRQSGMAQGIAETWLRKSIFHAGENHVALFVGAQTLRVFTYLLSHGFAGALTLAAFLWGMVLLLRKNKSYVKNGPTPRQLALLFGLPLVVTCAAALWGAYPYGGTRHDSFLALFGFGGASVGLTAWRAPREWMKPLVIFCCLALCNFFPAPPPPIRARNHGRKLMSAAMDFLRRSATPGSIVFSDYQSGLLLDYYACNASGVPVFASGQSFARSECGPYTVITARPQEWKFYGNTLPDELASMAQTYKLQATTKLWLVDAGWITDSAPQLRGALQQLGCAAPRAFGENIFVCEVMAGGSAPK